MHSDTIKITLSRKRQIEEELREMREALHQEAKEERAGVEDFEEGVDSADNYTSCLTRAFLKGRMAELESLLERSTIVENTAQNGEGRSMVEPGSAVILRDLESGEELEYTLVNALVASLLDNGLSEESPVGQALVHKTVGEVVEVVVPSGILRCQILAVHDFLP